MSKNVDYDKENNEELESIDRWMAVNTVFTIITGIGSLGLLIYQIFFLN